MNTAQNAEQKWTERTKTMIKLTESFKQWLLKKNPELIPLIMFGHLELFTAEMQEEYLEWCSTDEGRQYLKGGSKYKEVE